jgi:hypothetical protein
VTPTRVRLAHGPANRAAPSRSIRKSSRIFRLVGTVAVAGAFFGAAASANATCYSSTPFNVLIQRI